MIIFANRSKILEVYGLVHAIGWNEDRIWSFFEGQLVLCSPTMVGYTIFYHNVAAFAMCVSIGDGI
jgi:hypothetical protein